MVLRYVFSLFKNIKGGGDTLPYYRHTEDYEENYYNL